MGNDKWQPTKRLSWHQIDHLRSLRKSQPEEWSLSKLSRSFGISIPAVSKILKSKFQPTEEIRERQDARANEQASRRKANFLSTSSSRKAECTTDAKSKTNMSSLQKNTKVVKPLS